LAVASVSFHPVLVDLLRFSLQQGTPSMAPSPFFTDPIYSRMAEGLHVSGMSERAHDGYLRAVRKLADLRCTSPDKITENQLRQFFQRTAKVIGRE
jgi:hypothetical protein